MVIRVGEWFSWVRAEHGKSESQRPHSLVKQTPKGAPPAPSIAKRKQSKKGAPTSSERPYAYVLG
jgi:hypothetical protein